MSIRKSLFVGTIALGLSPLILANSYVSSADAWKPGAYVGLEAGYGMTNFDAAKTILDLAGLVDMSDTNAFAGRVYLGYDFHKNFAMEAGYSYFFNNPSITEKESKERLHFFGNTWAMDLMGVIKANVADNFGLFAKLGVNYLKATHSDQNTEEISNFNVAYGAGAYYNITRNVTMDISWLRYNGNQDTGDNYQPYADKFTVGVRYKFII
jgi:opacity protein-like surface antigen